MDILAHGLWTAAGAKAINEKILLHGKDKKPLNVYWAAFWGVFPDLFAFGIPFIWTLYNLATGNMSISDWPRPAHDLEPVPYTNLQPLQLAASLYTISHSLVVFICVFGFIAIVRRKPPRELFGWLLHIAIDIPTHSYKFFPTPILWPISTWKFLYGISWGHWWFQLINYSAITIVYILLWRKKIDFSQ